MYENDFAPIEDALRNLKPLGTRFHRISFGSSFDLPKETVDGGDGVRVDIALERSYGHKDGLHVFKLDLKSSNFDLIEIQVHISARYESDPDWVFDSESDWNEYFRLVVLPLMHQEITNVARTTASLVFNDPELIPGLQDLQDNFYPDGSAE